VGILVSGQGREPRFQSCKASKRTPQTIEIPRITAIFSAQRYSLPLRRSDSDSTGHFGPCEDGRRKIEKRTYFGGPCLEGTLRKPTQCFRIKPRGRGDSGNQIPVKTLDAGRARELQKCAQPATQMLSVHCLYQGIVKSARGYLFFRTKVYRDGTHCRVTRECEPLIEKIPRREKTASTILLSFGGYGFTTCVMDAELPSILEFPE